ncbi:hypothetical protein K9857_19985 [Pseudomonas sp. REP124]|uniref:hypothetical protein n=1 Tax=Pseudomonas sp. REP124 TaxID=2875731 RepID=UPI001CD03E1E|nr:hypothetical protein [Pseudomonas sp. REP124]MBZ9783817.1 hypothetical protein [Pseudomonas sp. REP124]
MSRQSQPFEEVRVDLAPPDLIDVLPEFEGGQENLLPKDGWLKPLRVEFERWGDSAQGPGMIDTLQLFFDDRTTPVHERKLEGPIDDAEFWAEVPAARLEEGVHSLFYRVLPWNGSTTRESVPVNVTIDKSPPILANASELIFPPAVLPPNALTADYLEDPQHNDQLLAIVPVYRTPAPGDVVIATWKNPGDGGSGEVRSEPLTRLNYNDPITLTFTGDFIRYQGDGKREVTYRVEDRATNASGESYPVELLVAAIRPPRHAPFPWIRQINDDPADWAELNPEATLQGATVIIPAEAIFYKDDRLEVCLGEPGSPGAVCVPVDPDAREVQIDKSIIGGFLDKTIPVFYVIHMPDGTEMPSRRLTLKVRAFPASKFHGAQLAAPFSDPVYKSEITAAGVPIFQRVWSYISTRCLITVTVTGSGKTETLLDAHQVLPAEASAGVSATISQTFLRSLTSDVRFVVLTKVSFDDGTTWFPFIELRPMLRD